MSLPLLEQHWEFLRARAVADDIARERDYQSATKKSELERLGFGRAQQLVAALVIPIWSVHGVVESYQLRPDQHRLNDKGKPRKYEMKAGGKMLLDVHPRLTRPREGVKIPLIADPAVPILITQGVPKGDAAVSIGLCCVALLGVWNFRGSNDAGGKTALADWESVALNGRSVHIVFDSDVMEKREIAAALARLKAFLESRNATVKVIYLPPGEHGDKVGLDDFIAREKTAGRSDAEIRDALLTLATLELRRPPAQTADSGLREIFIMAGQMPQIIDDAEKVLVTNAARLRLFQRAGEVVRVIALEREIDHAGLRRPPGTVQLAPVSTLYLQEIFDRLITWKRYDSKDGDKPADCPMRIAATYLARIGEWRLPHLTGIIEAPIMRRDGTVLNAPGFDESTGLYLHSESDWPMVPERPTRAQAEDSLQILLQPFSEFLFVDLAARSVFIAGIVTAIQRRLLESAPLFAFDAPSQRSGKSLLAESLGIIATGRKPSATGVAKEGDELRKAITSALRENQAIINLDNITRPLDSPDLARAITQSEYADRLLGVNRMLRLRTNVLWTATGNNLTFQGDLPSRALICRIDSAVERPEERVFKIADLAAHLLANRERLVVASLTILRAYHMAGRPRQDVKPWGGFDHWSRDIREPLVWLGLPDPCATRERLMVNDPERDLVLAIMSLWHEAFGARAMTVAEIISEASQELTARLREISVDRTNLSNLDPRRMGAWCRRIEDRIFGEFRLRREGSTQRAMRWKLSCVSSVSSPTPDQNGLAHTLENGSAPETLCTSPIFVRDPVNSPDSPNSLPSSSNQDDGIEV